MRVTAYFILLFLMISPSVYSQPQKETEEAYTKTIRIRVDKIVAPLAISDSVKVAKLREVIIRQYRNLNQLYTERDIKAKSAKALKPTNKPLADEQLRNLENEVNARLYNLHFEYIAGLMLYLSPAQIEQVKDGMTYGILPLTYKGYLAMIPRLTEEQKLQISVWLTEAREHAIDGGSSDEKHMWFGKYKGRINNYLSSAGYDLKKEGEEWQKRIRETKEAK